MGQNSFKIMVGQRPKCSLSGLERIWVRACGYELELLTVHM